MVNLTQTYWDQFLDELEHDGLKRQMRQTSGAQGREIVINGRTVLNFCSNNYLGLADDPRLARAATECMADQGFGAGASRLVCGNMDAHRALENALARFKGTEDCLLFSTGYMANVGIIPSLFGRDDIIFSDRLNHASIIDGIRLSQAQHRRYAHLDMQSLEAMLKKTHAGGNRCIITDSVFSMDGDIAPLDEIVRLAAQHECLVMIDEAHAFGVMGVNGKGLAEHFGLQGKIDIQMGTLSKAAGSFGAYCCGPSSLISFLINKARSFVYTTGLPPAVAAASTVALEIIASEPQRREQLWRHTHYLRAQLKAMGYDTLGSCTPIIPVLIPDPKMAIEFSERLFERGIFVSAIRPPTVPVNRSRLRLTVMATHTQEDVERVIREFQRIGEDLCLI